MKIYFEALQMVVHLISKRRNGRKFSKYFSLLRLKVDNFWKSSLCERLDFAFWNRPIMMSKQNRRIDSRSTGICFMDLNVKNGLRLGSAFSIVFYPPNHNMLHWNSKLYETWCLEFSILIELFSYDAQAFRLFSSHFSFRKPQILKYF